LLVFMLPVLNHQVPRDLSGGEAVYRRTGNVMILKTAESGRPIIWILPEKGKGVSS